MDQQDLDWYVEDANEMQREFEELSDRLAPGVSCPEQDEAKRLIGRYRIEIATAVRQPEQASEDQLQRTRHAAVIARHQFEAVIDAAADF